MKLRIALFLVCSMLTLSAQAQKSGVTVGLKMASGWTGRNVTETVDRELTDRYRQKSTFAGGVRIGYHVSKRFSLVADVEWQRLGDSRVRTFQVQGLTDGLGPLIFTTKYDNRFERIQVPLQIQFHPIPQIGAFYLSAGVMPTYLLKGRTTYSATSSRTGELPSGEVDIFDIPANQYSRRDVLFVSGIGTSIGKHLFVEATYQFNNPFTYSAFDPGNTFIGVPLYTSRANQGLLLSIIGTL